MQRKFSIFIVMLIAMIVGISVCGGCNRDHDNINGNEIGTYVVAYEGVSFEYSQNHLDFIGISDSLKSLKKLCAKNNYGFFDEKSRDYQSELGKQLQSYSQDFFKSKALVLCVFTESNYGGARKVETLDIKNNSLILKIKCTNSEYGDCVMVHWGFVVEVEKTYISTIKESTYLLS